MDKDKLKVIVLLATIIIGFLGYIACMIYAIFTNDIDINITAINNPKNIISLSFVNIAYIIHAM